MIQFSVPDAARTKGSNFEKLAQFNAPSGIIRIIASTLLL